jgi:membrane-bound lytic murein transglycosylase D
LRTTDGCRLFEHSPELAANLRILTAMHSLSQAIRAVATSRRTPWLLLAITLAVLELASMFPRLHASLAPPEVKAISAKIHDRAREYVQGLELIVSGDPVMGDNLLASSTDRLSVLAGDCVRTMGCDIDVVARALGTAVEERLRRRSTAAFLSAVRTRLVAKPASTVPTPAADERSPTRAPIDLAAAIPLNAPVKRALNDWLTWNRPQLVDAYESYLFLRQRLAPIYAEADLPEALLFGLLAQETGGKVHAYSSAGAAGLLQFMPVTARRYGLHPVSGFDMRLDPVAATRASAAYLTALLARFGDDLPKALAAYNLGENKLARLQRGLGEANFWDTRLSRIVPTETRLYVPGVLAASWIFAHAADYGLVVPLETGVTEITLKDPVSIGELTICLGWELNPGGWFRTLRNLNPRMSGSSRLDAGTSFRMPSVLVPTYVEQCAGDSPFLRRARDLHDAQDGTPNDLESAQLQNGLGSRRTEAGSPCS